MATQKIYLLSHILLFYTLLLFVFAESKIKIAIYFLLIKKLPKESIDNDMKLQIHNPEKKLIATTKQNTG